MAPERLDHQMLMRLEVPAHANPCDCVEKRLLTLTADGYRLATQFQTNNVQMWQAMTGAQQALAGAQQAMIGAQQAAGAQQVAAGAQQTADAQQAAGGQ